MPKRTQTPSKPKQASHSATTPEARENQMISLAVNLAEQQLRDGTASSQIIAHYLKLASTKERLELEKQKKEIELIVAKTEAIHSAQHIEELYSNALNAMRSYSGQEVVDDF